MSWTWAELPKYIIAAWAIIALGYLGVALSIHGATSRDGHAPSRLSFVLLALQGGALLLAVLWGFAFMNGVGPPFEWVNFNGQQWYPTEALIVAATSVSLLAVLFAVVLRTAGRFSVQRGPVRSMFALVALTAGLVAMALTQGPPSP